MRRKAKLTFENIPTDPFANARVVQDGYFKLDWSNTFAYPVRDATGYSTPMRGDAVGYNGGGFPSSFKALGADDTFTFKGGRFASAWTDDLVVTITGFRDGVEVGRWQGSVDQYTASALRFGNTFRDVDEIRFESVTASGLPSNLAMDNLRLTSRDIDWA
jgi:hypothetical protein